MKDVIKEILDCLEKYGDLTPDAIDDLHYLKDYITNLQEENEEIKNTIDFVDNKYKNTINYNEKLIEYNQDYKSRIEKLELENKVLKEQMVAMVQPNYVYGIELQGVVDD